MELLIVISIWMALGVIGGLIGQQHGKMGKGFLLGFLFGPIGWAMMLFDVSGGAILIGFAVIAVTGLIVVSAVIQSNEADERAAQRQRKVNEEEQLRRVDREAEAPRREIPKPATESVYVTPAPVVIPYWRPAPRRTPTPQEAAADIARRYGSK